MIEVDGLKISASQGDTGSVTITFTGQDVPPDGTRFRMTLKKTIDSEAPVWEKTIAISGGRVTIPFYEQDTNLGRGQYFWIPRLLYENGDRWTPVEELPEFIILPSDGKAGDTDGG